MKFTLLYFLWIFIISWCFVTDIIFIGEINATLQGDKNISALISANAEMIWKVDTKSQISSFKPNTVQLQIWEIQDIKCPSRIHLASLLQITYYRSHWKKMFRWDASSKYQCSYLNSHLLIRNKYIHIYSCWRITFDHLYRWSSTSNFFVTNFTNFLNVSMRQMEAPFKKSNELI